MKTSSAREAWGAPRRAKHARWGPASPSGATVHAWARRILTHPSSVLGKPLDRVLEDLTHYDLDLVAWCCSHVEIVAAAGVNVRSFAGLLFHMLERGGTAAEGFHDLATPNEDEHQEQIDRLRSPTLPRRRASSEPENGHALAADAVPHLSTTAVPGPAPRPSSTETRPVVEDALVRARRGERAPRELGR